MQESGGRDEGWTLLELMAVILILGILTAIVVASYTLSLDRSRRVSCQENQRILNNAIVMYEQQHDGSVPATLTDIQPFVAGRQEFDVCPGDANVHYVYNPVTGQVTCPLHAAQ
jgi:prepilin-type N-terminal cleavage/methylation domain-containing protein